MKSFWFVFIAALTVRYLTRRFIGEYRSNTDLLYKQTITLESGLLDVEIVDISAENDNEFPIEQVRTIHTSLSTVCLQFSFSQIQWADAVLIVYSIIDRESFEWAVKSLGELRQLQSAPTYLVANKADLDHLRVVNTVYFLIIYINTMRLHWLLVTTALHHQPTLSSQVSRQWI